MYLLFGDSDFTARLAPALMGTAMVPMCALLRGQLGRIGAFSAALALTFGPTFLYYSRFAREDIYFAAITLALIAVTARFLDRPRAHQPALIGALLALSFATKETTFITVFVAGTFFLVAIAEQTRVHGFRDGQVIRAIGRVGWEAWAWALAAFLAVFTLLFTVFLTDPGGLWAGLYDGIDYWLSQHGPGRGESEEYFYSVVLLAVEWPIVLLGARGRRRDLQAAVDPARVPDLGLHPLAGRLLARQRALQLARMHPLLPLIAAGRLRGAGDLGGAARLGRQARAGAGRRRRAARGLRVVPRERARTAPTRASSSSPRSPPRRSTGVRDEVLAAKARADREGRDLSVVVDSAEGATFPWAWYFRHLDATYPDLTREALPSEADVVIAHPGRPRPGRRRARGLRGARVPVPRVVGARLRRDVAVGLVGLVHAARAVEPDGRHARVALPAPGRVAQRISHTVGVAGLEDALAEPVPLRDARVAVVRALERADDDVADPVAVEQLAGGLRRPWSRRAWRRPPAGSPRRGPTGARGPASPAPSAAP